MTPYEHRIKQEKLQQTFSGEKFKKYRLKHNKFVQFVRFLKKNNRRFAKSSKSKSIPSFLGLKTRRSKIGTSLGLLKSSRGGNLNF